MNDKIDSVLYTRVSTDKEEQKTSYVQQQKFKDNRFNIINIFDDKASGTNIKKRTGFIEMLKYIGIEIVFIGDDYLFNIFKATDIKVLIVSNTSRFSRNLIDAKRAIEILHKQGVKVFFNDINSYSDNEQIEILLNIYFTLDQQYSKDLSKKVKHGLQRLVDNEGYILVTGNMKGYNVKGGKLYKNEDSEKIKEIYNDYVFSNSSIRKLAEKYKWNQSTIGNILKNKKYAGYNKQEDNELHPSIEPIITLDLWEKAQTIRLSRRRLNGKDKAIGLKSNTYGLSSKLVCPICGGNLSYRKGRNKKYGIWSCYTSEARARKGVKCSNPAISENRINQYLKEMIKSNQWRRYIEFEINLKLENIKLIEIDDLKLNISNVELKNNKLLDLYLNNEILKGMYMERKEKLDYEKSELLNQLKNAEDLNNYKNSLEELKKNYMEKLDIIENFIDNENFEEVHKLIKNVYFAYNYNIAEPKAILNLKNAKKKLFVSKIIFKDFNILDNFKF